MDFNVARDTFFALFPFLRPMMWPYWVTAVLALNVLVSGRRLPWLFAGLGGFLLGQLLGATVLRDWQLVPVFGLSAALGAALGALALAAERPVVILAAFLGVGFLAFTLARIAGAGNPWELIAYVLAGASAAALLFRSFERALIFASVLSAAGAVAAILPTWMAFTGRWNNWSVVIVAGIAVVVGLIHQFRELPAEARAPIASGVARRAG
jgi:hypothetical protein